MFHSRCQLVLLVFGRGVGGEPSIGPFVDRLLGGTSWDFLGRKEALAKTAQETFTPWKNNMG